MNLGKRIAALLLIAMLMSAFTACETKPSTPQDSHLDWVYILSTRNQGAVTEDGYYYSARGVLNYADFATGKSAVLCAKPGCTHEEDNYANPCDAEMPFSGDQIFFENDTLYYLGDENVLHSRDATGSSLKEWGMLGKKFIEDRMGLIVIPLALCNGYLYYEGYIIDIKKTDGVLSTSDATSRCICRYNIAQQKDEVLVLLEDMGYYESIEPYAARENGLIYLYAEGLDPEQDWENVDVKKCLEARKKMPVHIKHLNLTTGETTTILTATYGDVSSVADVYNGKLYYTKSLNDGNSTCEVHNYNLVTGKDTVVYTNVSPAAMGKGYWRCTKWLDAQTAEVCLYDMNAGKEVPYERKETFSVINRSEYGLVVFDKSSNRSFISYDSLADGLQEDDLEFLYIGNWTT